MGKDQVLIFFRVPRYWKETCSKHGVDGTI